MTTLTREQAIKRHSELMHEHGIFCGPNKDYQPDGMLYYKNGDDKFSFFEINSHDPVVIIPILEKRMTELLAQSLNKDDSNE
ncbi:MAG: hypothetical protein MJK15_03400 [Colwellia sp.]|nr:hypothetical protein [Colwellia sp.]